VIIPYSGLTGPILAFANEVNRWAGRLVSVPSLTVAEVSDLPNPEQNNLRTYVVADIGTGNPGLAVSIGGAWKTVELT
jgi:hypothetical protein